MIFYTIIKYKILQLVKVKASVTFHYIKRLANLVVIPVTSNSNLSLKLNVEFGVVIPIVIPYTVRTMVNYLYSTLNLPYIE